MGDVSPPPAERGDFALAFTEERLSEDSEHLGAVREADLADGEPGRLLEQDVDQPGARDAPNFDGDGYPAFFPTDPNHGGVAIPDGPEAIGGLSGGFLDERGAGLEEVGIEFEPAHQGAVDGEEGVGGRRGLSGLVQHKNSWGLVRSDTWLDAATDHYQLPVTLLWGEIIRVK